MAKVTVIIPIYNSEKYISKCIESVLNQTYKDFEIMLINDGSKDKSLEIIKEFESKNPQNIKVVDQQNMGVAKTRNQAILNSNSEYVMFIDNDDYIDIDYIETYVNEAEKGFDIVLGGYRRPNENGKIIKELKLQDEEWSKFMILAPWAKIYKRQYLIDNNLQFLSVNIGEDVYFNLQAMVLTDKIKIIDYIGYNWFFNSKSVSNTLQKNITNLQVYELLNSTYDELKQKGALETKYDIIEAYFIRYIVWLLLFSTKKLDSKIINNEYDKIFNWLKTRFPQYKKNKFIGLSKPKGEIFSVRLTVFIFMLANKCKLGKFLLHIYSKI